MRKTIGRKHTLKAQVQSEIIIYILAVIVTSMILLYGYSSIMKMRKQTEEVAVTQFKTDLENSIESLGYEFGTIDKKAMSVPAGIDEVCFLQLDDPPDPTGKISYYPLINDSLGKSNNNVFLLGGIGFQAFHADGIATENSFNCFKQAGGKIDITLEARGRSVYVS